MMEEFKTLLPFCDHWSELFKSYRFVGSRVTVDPPPLDTDQDVLCLVSKADSIDIENAMKIDGFVREGSCPADMDINTCGDNTFFSMRKGEMNYIITCSEDFYKRFSAATELAKLYNLKTKVERVQLFQAVLYGNWVKS